jgi:hypothetical protein
MAMARRSTLRASDSDRELIAERLRNATGEGRLIASELEERLESVFSARTYGELDAVVADLPAPVARRRGTLPLWAKGALVLAVVLAVLAVVAMVALVILGLAGAWMAWLLIGWLWFGRGRRVGRGGCSWSRARRVGVRSSPTRSPGGGTASL